MSETPTHIAAVVCNAHSDEEHYKEYVLAYYAPDCWYDVYRNPIYPYWTQPIEFQEPTYDGVWLQHLRQLADSSAALRYEEPPPPKLSLAELGLIAAPPKPLNIRRRV